DSGGSAGCLSACAPTDPGGSAGCLSACAPTDPGGSAGCLSACAPTDPGGSAGCLSACAPTDPGGSTGCLSAGACTGPGCHHRDHVFQHSGRFSQSRAWILEAVAEPDVPAFLVAWSASRRWLSFGDSPPAFVELRLHVHAAPAFFERA